MLGNRRAVRRKFLSADAFTRQLRLKTNGMSGETGKVECDVDALAGGRIHEQDLFSSRRNVVLMLRKQGGQEDC